MTAATITAIAEDALTYNGTAQEPKPAVTFNGKQLTENQDFTYSWSNNTNAGKSSDASAPQVTITGKGNFKNTNTLKFTINPASITSVEVSGTNFSYVPGETKQMTITKVMAGTLVLDKTDYTVTGDQATAVGDYVLTVTGTGNFKDSKTVDWHILERKANVSFGTKKYITFYDAAETFLVPDDVTAYIVTNVSGNTVVVKEVSFIKKSVPVLLESTPGKNCRRQESVVRWQPSEIWNGRCRTV